MQSIKFAIILIVVAAVISQNAAHKKKSKLFKKHHTAKSESTETGKASKRQDMSFNDEIRPNNEGPIGQSEAGVEGLGGDMHGYPTGMGAGAEPLGAFENEDTPAVGGQSEGQQTLDDKSDSAAGQGRPFASQGSSQEQEADRSENENERERENEEGNSNEEDSNSIAQNEPMKMKESPRPAAVSMSNNVNDLDGSMNVQGDGEIGKYIRNAQQSHSEDSQEPDQDQGLENNDPPFTGQVDENTAEELKEGADNENDRQTEEDSDGKNTDERPSDSRAGIHKKPSSMRADEMSNDGGASVNAQLQHVIMKQSEDAFKDHVEMREAMDKDKETPSNTQDVEMKPKDSSFSGTQEQQEAERKQNGESLDIENSDFGTPLTASSSLMFGFQSNDPILANGDAGQTPRTDSRMGEPNDESSNFSARGKITQFHHREKNISIADRLREKLKQGEKISNKTRDARKVNKPNKIPVDNKKNSERKENTSLPQTSNNNNKTNQLYSKQNLRNFTDKLNNKGVMGEEKSKILNQNISNNRAMSSSNSSLSKTTIVTRNILSKIPAIYKKNHVRNHKRSERTKNLNAKRGVITDVSSRMMMSTDTSVSSLNDDVMNQQPKETYGVGHEISYSKLQEESKKFSNYVPEDTEESDKVSNYAPESTHQVSQSENFVPKNTQETSETSTIIPENTQQPSDPSNIVPENVHQTSESSRFVSENTHQMSDSSSFIPENRHQMRETSNSIPDNIHRASKFQRYIPDYVHRETTGYTKNLPHESRSANSESYSMNPDSDATLLTHDDSGIKFVYNEGENKNINSNRLSGAVESYNENQYSNIQSTGTFPIHHHGDTSMNEVNRHTIQDGLSKTQLQSLFIGKKPREIGVSNHLFSGGDVVFQNDEDLDTPPTAKYTPDPDTIMASKAQKRMRELLKTNVFKMQPMQMEHDAIMNGKGEKFGSFQATSLDRDMLNMEQVVPENV